MLFRNLKLAPKIIILLVTVIFGLMSIYGIFQIKKIEESLNSDAEKNHILLLSNSLGVFAKSIWEFDKDISTRGMNPLFDGGTVESIQIYDVRGKLFNGLRFNKSIEGKTQLNSIPEGSLNYSDLKIGEPSKPKKAYNDKPSLMISPMENYPNQQHRLIASLWWKESAEATPNFLGNVVMEFSTGYIAARIYDQKLLFVSLAIILSISILLLTFIFLEFQVILPIRKLMEASLEVASGKFTTLNPMKTKDEIGSLTENFNFMVNKIERNLNLIRGLSEASQEIVKCKSPHDVAEVYGIYAQKLLKAEKVEIWINSLSEASNDAKNMKRLSDNKDSELDDPNLQLMLSTKEVIRREENQEDDFIHVMVVPLLNSNNILLGMVEIFYNKNKVKYGEEEVRIIKGLAVSLSTAIENYWHVIKEKDRANLERDVELASAVQDSIVSKNVPKSDKYCISTYYKTASSCGGDWFGMYDLGEDKLLILFGDVTGHGTPAALITAVTRGAADMLKLFVLQDPTKVSSDLSAKSLEYINLCISQTGRQTYFMTMIAALFDFKAGKMYASSAGHTPPALIFPNEGKSEIKYIYPANGSRLGFDPEFQYQTQTFDFKPGQQILFYTDGIIEGENRAGKEYGLKKFKQSMETHGSETPEVFIEKISEDAFKFFDGTPPKDDIAMLVVRHLKS